MVKWTIIIQQFIILSIFIIRKRHFCLKSKPIRKVCTDWPANLPCPSANAKTKRTNQHFHILNCQLCENTLTRSIFAGPAKAKTALNALSITGYVKVTRLGGGFGESSMAATHLSVTSNSRWPGKREQVWPSGPAPSNKKSNWGNKMSSAGHNCLNFFS